MSHNCAVWSVLGVVGEEEDLTMDYVREGEEEVFLLPDPEMSQPLNTGYNFRPSDRWRN